MIDYSDDRARLDVPRIHAWLAGSYWSPGIARETVERALAGSHPLGAFRDGAQVGYARIISDRATFGWIADVFVDESVRGEGISRGLVGWFLAHSAYRDLRRIALVTADAHGVYAPLGFHPLIRPDRYMERLHPDAEALLRAAP
ncbi:GNAT family N-acetyltransferase [Sphingomonas sp.]|uniref:GNAT family N-acetyltransferase n=1 Tax=Sphingomonas sp. TaxID=28214 RepID=UPI0035C7AF4D